MYRIQLIYILFLLCGVAFGQADHATWVNALKTDGVLPEKLLSGRTAIFYSYHFTPKELTIAQENFERTGIDAIVYFDMDKLMAGDDVTRAYANYLKRREIDNIIVITKAPGLYNIFITVFNKSDQVVEKGQSAYVVSNQVWSDALKTLHRLAANAQKKQNLLVNPVPEMDIPINSITGKRNEFYAIDLKVDPLAVPKFGDEKMDARLEEIFKEHYPWKYKLTEPGLDEATLRRQGYYYVVELIYTRATIAKEVLGYETSSFETAIASVTYPESQQQLKNIPANTPVYKAYFKHIDSGNVFLGTKWDADLSWEQALINQIKGLKAELRVN